MAVSIAFWWNRQRQSENTIVNKVFASVSVIYKLIKNFFFDANNFTLYISSA
jgi:hypothetical protein